MPVDVPTFAQSLIAGGVAGTTVDLSLFPIDTLKTRLQSSAGFAASGGFRGVYAGIGSAVVGSAPGAALFFVSYEKSKTLFAQWRSARQDGTAKRDDAFAQALEHMGAASIGEVAACAVRVPTEVVKQRAQASSHRSSAVALKAILDVRHTSRGFTGLWNELYRGWSITILREVPFTVIQFPLWEALKKRQNERTGRSSSTTLESALFGCAAGAVAAACTTPLDVLKTRMMLAKQKVSLATIARDVWTNEGPRAFLSGIGPRCGWISAGGAIFLGAYQWALNALGGRV